MNFHYSAFISYRRKSWSQKCARLFYDLLNEYEEEYNHKVFFDDNTIEVGSKISEDIIQGISQSMSLLFFIVPISIEENHPWCTLELSHFFDHECARINKIKGAHPNINENDYKQIIPILVRGDDSLLQGILRERKYIDIREATISLRKDSRVIKRAFKEITNSINRLKIIFKDFNNDITISPPSFDYKENIQKIGYTPAFPTIKLNKNDGAQ